VTALAGAERLPVAEVLSALARNASLADEQAVLPDDDLRALAAGGLLEALVPAVHGGPGISLAQFASLAADLGSASPSTAYVWAMHCQQVDALYRHGTSGLHDRCQAILNRGQTIGSVTTEATSSLPRHDAQRPGCAALRRESGLRRCRCREPASGGSVMC